jgi:hypothetical protein
MSEPHPELQRWIVAHRTVRRPAPALRQQVARAIAADRRQEQLRRWVGGSLVGAVMGVAALLVAHWIAVGLAAHRSSERALDGAQYQSPRDGRTGAMRARGAGATRDPEPAPRAPEASAAGQPPAAIVTPDPPPTPRSEARAPTKPTIATADLASEVRLLREAEVALSTDPALALTLLEAHVHQFPRTSLALERRALQILARCGAAPGDAAAHDRDAFLREHPGSAYAPRVRAACR